MTKIRPKISLYPHMYFLMCSKNHRLRAIGIRNPRAIRSDSLKIIPIITYKHPDTAKKNQRATIMKNWCWAPPIRLQTPAPAPTRSTRQKPSVRETGTCALRRWRHGPELKSRAAKIQIAKPAEPETKPINQEQWP
jgi:hypothetical protein